MKTYQNFLSENFPFLVVKFSIYLNRHVFVMSAELTWIYESVLCGMGVLFTYYKV